MVDPNDDSLEGESLEDHDAAGLTDEDRAQAPAGHDRPRSTGVALLISAGLVWAGVFAVRVVVPNAPSPNHSAALDIPEDLPTLEDVDDVDKAPETPLDLGGGVEEPPQDDANEDAPDETSEVADEPPPSSTDADGEQARPVRNIHLTARDPRWSEKFRAPDHVHYTIRQGGTLKRVANLYKIFHHEIVDLNPGKGLDQELPSGTRVAVYRRGENPTTSQSIDGPARGALTGAMPMPEGPGRILKHIPWKGWATVEAVAVMDAVLRSWDALETGQPILVGNMSSRKGGPLKPHQSHQSGRDIDLSYPQIIDERDELNWREMSAANLDRELMWTLLELLNDTGAVEVVYVDTKLQKLLYDWAIQTGRVPRRDLGRWLEYPRKPGQAKYARVQHSRGHSDHMHVRFSCPKGHRRCR
jgi:hypothetical protein